MEREGGVFSFFLSFFLLFFSGGGGGGGVGGGGISVYVCLSVRVPGQDVLNSQPFVTRLGMVMHHHQPELSCEKMWLNCYLQSKGSYDKNMTVSTIYKIF